MSLRVRKSEKKKVREKKREIEKEKKERGKMSNCFDLEFLEQLERVNVL